MRVERRRHDLLVADGLVSPSLAAAISAAIATATFEEQHLGSALHRYRERAVLDDPVIAAGLWEALAPHVGDLGTWLADSAAVWERPPHPWTAVGCNPRSRVYRYHPGANFAVHRDLPWTPDPDTRSVLTVLVYLPAPGCVGGETRFVNGERVDLADWRIAVFDHALAHEGTVVERGTKLVLRNDVIATCTGPA